MPDYFNYEEEAKKRGFKPMPGEPLKNIKWEHFAYEVVKGTSQSQAAKLAGYKTKSNVQGARLIAKDIIAARVRELQEWKKQQAAISIDDVVVGLKEVANRCMKKIPVMKWDYELGQYVQEVDEDGNDVWTFDSQGANKSLELLGKHVGAFEKDNLQKAPVITVVIYDEDEEEEFTTPIEIKDVDTNGDSGKRESKIQNPEEGISSMLPPSTTE